MADYRFAARKTMDGMTMDGCTGAAVAACSNFLLVFFAKKKIQIVSLSVRIQIIIVSEMVFVSDDILFLLQHTSFL